jgi:hypothetical protein
MKIATKHVKKQPSTTKAQPQAMPDQALSDEQLDHVVGGSVDPQAGPTPAPGAARLQMAMD